MKRITLAVFLVAMAFPVSAQWYHTNPVSTSIKTDLGYNYQNINTSKALISHKPLGKKAGVVDAWYNYTDGLINWYFGIQYFAPFMAPDTFMITPLWDANGITGWDRAAWNSAGAAFDPNDQLYDFDSDAATESFNNYIYQIDSLQIPYFYYKPRTNVTDTLIVQIWKGNGNKGSGAESWQYVSGGDTVRFTTAQFDINKGIGKNALQTIKVPLTLADTATAQLGLLNVALNQPVAVQPGYRFLATFTYKPTGMSQKDTFAGPMNFSSKYYNSFRFLMTYDPYANVTGTHNNGVVVQYQQRHNPFWLQNTSDSARYLSGTAFNSTYYPNVYFHVMVDLPSNLTAQSKTASTIDLAWNDNSVNEQAYVISRSLNGTSGWVDIDTISTNSTTYTDINLTTNTKYYYRVAAFNGTDLTGWSNVASATPVKVLPAAPSALQASLNNGDVQLSWTDNSGNEFGFYIYRSIDNVTFSKYDSVGADVTAYMDTAVVEGGSYWYKVAAYNADGPSGYTNTVKISIPSPLPAIPTNLQAMVSGSDIQLAWNDESADEDGFYIYRSVDGVSFNKYDSVVADEVSYLDTGVTIEVMYWYKIKAYNSGGASAFSNTVSIMINLPPLAPGMLNAVLAGSDVELDWTDNSHNEDGFYIYRSTDGTNYYRYDSVVADEVFFVDMNTLPGLSYWYQVTAYNNAGESDTSNSAKVDIPTAISEALAPFDVNVYPNPARDAVRLSFSLPEGGMVNIRVTDITGKQLITASENVSAGLQYVDLNTVSFEPGVYFTTIGTGSGKAVVRFIIAK